MRALACAVVVIVLALGAGCGGEARGGSIDIVGGTAEQRTLLRSIEDGLRPTAIRSVSIRNIGVVGFPSKDWAEISIRPRDGQGRTVRAEWETYVLAGAFRDRSAEEGLAQVEVLDYGGGVVRIERVRATPTASPEPASPAERIGIARTFAESAIAQGAELERLDVLTPAGPAVALVLRVDEPAAFVKQRFLPIVKRWWANDRLEGAYLLVEDRQGRFVMEHAFSKRGVEASWRRFRPDLAGCDPIIPIGVDPRAKPPPPCPAA
jgi:hypothetical protein